MFKLIFSDQLDEDIAVSSDYIENTLHAPMAARRHLEEIRKKYKQLRGNPFVRPLVHNKFLASHGIRLIRVKNYLLIYKINEESGTVSLLRLFHCKRDWMNMLTNDIIQESYS